VSARRHARRASRGRRSPGNGSVAHRRCVHETAEEPVPLARRCQPAEVWVDSEQRRPVVDRYQHAWCAGRGDPWRVGRMRVVRGEPERGDDRGALVRCQVTQRDEALVEPHLDAGGAADRDGVERAPAVVLAVVQLAQRGAGQPDGLRGNGAVAAAGQFGGGGEEPDRPATVRRPPRAEERRVRGAGRSSDRTPVRVRRRRVVVGDGRGAAAPAVAPHARINHRDIRPGHRPTFDAQRTGNRERRSADSRTWPQRPTERVPERTVLPQPVPSCTG